MATYGQQGLYSIAALSIRENVRGTDSYLSRRTLSETKGSKLPKSGLSLTPVVRLPTDHSVLAHMDHLVMRLAHKRLPGTVKAIPRKGFEVQLRLSNIGVQTMT